MSERSIGILQIILSGACFGFLGLFGKSIYAKGVVPGEMLSLRFLLAAILTFSYLLLRHRQLFRLSLKQVASCALLGIAGYAVFSFCFFSALQGLSASLSVLLLYTYPVMVAGFGYILFRETIARQKLIAFPFAALGLLGLVWGDFAMERASYLIFGIAAAVFYALYILISARLLKATDPRIATPLIQLFAGLFLGAFYLRDLGRTETILRENWLLFLALAVICSIAAMGLFLAGLQKLRSWEVSLLSTTEPLMGVILASLFLGESLSLSQYLSAVSVVIALVWVSLPEKVASLPR